jgi:hypothetical protein
MLDKVKMEKFPTALVDHELSIDVELMMEDLRMSEIQLNAILGSVLGDACLARPASATANSPVRWNHSWKQAEYVFHKHQLLKEFATREPVKRENKGYGDYWAVLTLKSLNIFHLLYDVTHPCGAPEKTVTPTFLSLITHPVALAWWFMDDGSRPTGSNTGNIATNGFSYEEVDLLRVWLKDRWGLIVNVIEVKHSSTGKTGYVLSLPKNAFVKLSEMIAPYVPDCMKYKIEVVMQECALCGKTTPKGHSLCCSPACAQELRKIRHQEYLERTKDSRREKSRQWKAANRERVREMARAAYARMTPEQKEKLAEYSKAYKEKHRDEINARRRAWRAMMQKDPAFRAKKAEEDKAYRERLKQDPERYAAYQQRKLEYARIHNADPEVHQRMMERQRARRAAVNADPEKKAAQLARDRASAKRRRENMTPEELAEYKRKEAEQNKKYREKLKQDPEKLAARKEKDSQKYKEKYAQRTQEERDKINARRRELRRLKAEQEGRPFGRWPKKDQEQEIQQELF